MTDDLPDPPPVTIIDPGRPAATSDVLSSGRDPWRPPRRQVLLTAGAVAILAVLTAGTVSVVHALQSRAEHRRVAALRAAEIAHVNVVLTAVCCRSEDPAQDVLLLSVGNAGPDPVTPTSVSLDGADAYLDSSPEVLPGLTVPTAVTFIPACGPGAGRQVPDTLLVTLRLPHGGTWKGSVHVTGDEFVGLASLVRQRCGTLTPQEGVATEVVGSHEQGRSLVLRYQLVNTAQTPMRVIGLRAPTGMSASLPGLPFVLGPGSPESPTSITKTVVVRPRDCSAFRREQSASEDVAILLRLTVQGQYETQVLSMFMNSENNGILETEVDADELLRGWCGL